jgi:ubiquinone/menaquinone biosynthesis C-methylase UbiE
VNSSRASAQSRVNSYFAAEADYWARLYEENGVKEAVHQERLRLVIDIVDDLPLPYGAPVIDVGCGAGFAAAAMAERGYKVHAVDAVPAMLEATRARLAGAGLRERATIEEADASALPFPDGAFRLLLAIGVLPWLAEVETPTREMLRVLAPGGWLIATVDNRWGLRQLVEPLENPLLALPRKMAGRLLRRQPSGVPRVRSYQMSITAFDRLLARAGAEKQLGRTIGFGPLTLFGRHLLPRPTGLLLHRRLQDLAARGAPVLRSAGSQYVVLARKSLQDESGSHRG